MIRNNNEIFITEDESKICKLDGKIFSSSKRMIWYVRKTYKLDFEHYIINTYYDGLRPVCIKTGRALSFKASKLGPFFHNYSKNEFLRNPHTNKTKEKIKLGCEKTSIEKYGVKNVFSTDWCKEKIKCTMQEKYGVDNSMEIEEIKKRVLNAFFETMRSRPPKVYITQSFDPNISSSLEKDLREKLIELNMKFESPFKYQGKKYDFYIPSINSTVEIDGDAFHKNTLENLSIITINGSVNDYNKNNLIQYNSGSFYRIRYDPNNFLFSSIDELVEKISEYKYNPDYSLTYKQKIVDKEYFKLYISTEGKDKLKKYSHHFLKFIRTFQPTLPYPDLEENLSEIIAKIRNYDNTKIYDPEKREFSNNTSTVGHNYLKHYFKSYWKSKFNGNPSPVEAWLDDKIMQEVIDYRIGCNNSGEVYDFSLHQLIRGLSARRVTVSFFKPLLAASIYEHYIGYKEDPIVLDPCCGFGGRLLGFKSIYPNGKYVGCEPNIETYTELQQLIKNTGWTNIEIYNCKFEEFNTLDNFDLIFTSIPYYDVELYSNNTEYKSFDEWRNIFIKSIEQYSGKNCYINTPHELCNKLGWNNIDAYIKSNRSHFDKKSGDKKEPIIKL